LRQALGLLRRASALVRMSADAAEAAPA
jgi:hypothetical protein